MEVIVFSAKEKLLEVATELQSIPLKTTDQARNLGGMMDTDLHFDKNMKALTKANYHL